MNELAAENAATLRDQAVSRSLDSARARAEQRVQRFLDAALEFMNDTETGKEFTVQEVVERSGQSLRSFYQYFGGKHELLLALFEESVRSTADHLRSKIAEQDEPLERLHVFVVEYYRACRPVMKGRLAKNGPRARVMVDFAQQLRSDHPTEAAKAFYPLATLFEEVLDEAAAAGHLRSHLSRRPIAGIVLEAVMFDPSIMGGSPITAERGDPAEDLWDLMLHGIARTDLEVGSLR